MGHPGSQSRIRIKTLNGAPLLEQLDFTEPALLALDRCNEFHYDFDHSFSVETQPTSSLKWRLIPWVKEPQSSTGRSQPFLNTGSSRRITPVLHFIDEDRNKEPLGHLKGEPSGLFASNTLTEIASGRSDFLRQSFCFNNTLNSSQVLSMGEANDAAASASFEMTSFSVETFVYNDIGQLKQHPSSSQLSSRFVTTALAALPNAQQLESLYPQIPTPNFLCVLAAKATEQEVIVRRTGHRMILWELIVTDDTIPSFRVSFWFRPEQGSVHAQFETQSILLHTLRNMKVGDILLLRRIALTSYRNVVYGQSLSSSIKSLQSSIEIVSQHGRLSALFSREYPSAFLENCLRMKIWAEKYVVTSGSARKTRKIDSALEHECIRRPSIDTESDEHLPPDTMDTV